MSENKYKIKIDNLAIPEIKTGEDIDTEDTSYLNTVSQSDITVSYETLAIPEIHINHQKD